jgi:hypothetical protein
MAQAGDVGAAAALFSVAFVLPAHTIVTRHVSDVGTSGASLVISNHDAGLAILFVSDPMLRGILSLLISGRNRDEWLFPASGHTRPDRRQYTEDERRAILAKYDAACQMGKGQALLAKYGMNSGQISHWRRRLLCPPPPQRLPRERRGDNWVRAQIRRICRAAGVAP